MLVKDGRNSETGHDDNKDGGEDGYYKDEPELELCARENLNG